MKVNLNQERIAEGNSSQKHIAIEPPTTQAGRLCHFGGQPQPNAGYEEVSVK